MKRIGHIIGGEEIVEGDAIGPVFNPATGRQSGEVLLGCVREVALAVDAAKDALPEWSARPPAKRAGVMFSLREIMKARRDEIAETISAEHGKTHEDALGEVTRALEVVEYARFFQRCRRRRRHPCGARTAWRCGGHYAI